MIEAQENKLFKNSNDFSMFIERQSIEEGVTCLQALIDYCESEGIDFEDVAKNVNRQLKAKLELDFVELGMLKSTASLDM